MHCPHCRESNPDGARFCGACGEKIEEVKPSGGLDSVFKWIGMAVVGLFVVMFVFGA